MFEYFEIFWTFLGYDYVDASKPTLTPHSMTNLPKNKFFNFVVSH